MAGDHNNARAAECARSEEARPAQRAAAERSSARAAECARDDAGPLARIGRSLRGALAHSRPLLLDGATGTELERRGVRSALPLWSSWALLEAPDTLRAIHGDYLRAGAGALTTATFRTHARSLAAAGLEGRAAELTALAVRLAREAAEETRRPAFVLGSAAPLEDCYHPERVPDAAALAREHAAHAGHLVAAGADAILVETMNTRREAVAAARAAREAGADVLVSFVCGTGARLLSGEPLDEALDAVGAFEPLALGVNCLPPGAVAACLGPLRQSGRAFLVYANLTTPGPEPVSPEAYAGAALGWIREGAACVGGCCGTTPSHIAALASRLREACPPPRAAE
jgi:S-methylmethionine-dependent homocysteine/selenocysteine methylase